MFKKTIATVVAASVIFGGIISTPAMAAPGEDKEIIPVIVNGQKVKFPDTEPYINTDGRTMVPVRFVSEMLGAEVKWEENTETAIIKYDGKTIRMPIGSKTVTVDGKKEELDTAAEKYEGRTMVPLRFVSEVLDSEVKWDEKAHSVRVTDAEYQAKIDSGKVALDPWGRELSTKWDANWMKLTDLSTTKFYTTFQDANSRSFIEERVKADVYRMVADVLAEKIRSYYEMQLNVDYRTINEAKFVEALLNASSGKVTMDAHRKYQTEKMVKEYVAWVKKNKVVAKGYADPEMMGAYNFGDNLVWVPTHFKFMIISADDTAQTFLDNWKVSSTSESFKLKKGVWYDGYSVVSMDTVVANSRWSDEHGIRHTENMFYKYNYFYNIQE